MAVPAAGAAAGARRPRTAVSTRRDRHAVWDAQFDDEARSLFASGKRGPYVRETTRAFDAAISASAAEMHRQAYLVSRGVRGSFVTPRMPSVRAFGYRPTVREPRLPPELPAAQLAVRKFDSKTESFGLERVMMQRLRRSMDEYNLSRDHYCILEALAGGKVPRELVERQLGPDMDVDAALAMYERRFGPDDAVDAVDAAGPVGVADDADSAAESADAANARAVQRALDTVRARSVRGTNRHSWRATVRKRPSTASVVPDRHGRIRDRVPEFLDAPHIERPATAAATVAAVRAAAEAAAPPATAAADHTHAPPPLVDIMVENAKHAHAGYKAHEDAGLTKLRFRSDVRTKPPTVSYSGERRRILAEFPLKPTTIHEEVRKDMYAAALADPQLSTGQTQSTGPPSGPAPHLADPAGFIGADDLVGILIRPRSTKYDPVVITGDEFVP